MGEETEDLWEFYLETTRELITEMEQALMKLEENKKDEAAMKLLVLKTHTLKGNSRQIGQTLIAQLADKMYQIAEKVEKNKIIKEIEISKLATYLAKIKSNILLES